MKRVFAQAICLFLIAATGKASELWVSFSVEGELQHVNVARDLFGDLEEVYYQSFAKGLANAEIPIGGTCEFLAPWQRVQVSKNAAGATNTSLQLVCPTNARVVQVQECVGAACLPVFGPYAGRRPAFAATSSGRSPKVSIARY